MCRITHQKCGIYVESADSITKASLLLVSRDAY